jgi:CBS-domain-containing membrane protein
MVWLLLVVPTTTTRLQTASRLARQRLQRIAPHARLGAGVAASAGALAAVGGATSSSLLLAPFVATAALKHSLPGHTFARPRNVIGGYAVGALIGTAAGLALGGGWLAIALGASVAAVVLVALDLEHPPAVAMAVIALQAPGVWPLEVALAGSVTLVLTMALLGPSLHGRPWRGQQRLR